MTTKNNIKKTYKKTNKQKHVFIKNIKKQTKKHNIFLMHQNKQQKTKK